jgi:peptidyl-prolyl cis-trans isomerase B (cyclophilin B)
MPQTLQLKSLTAHLAISTKQSKSMMILALLMIFFVHDSPKAFAQVPFTLPPREQLMRLQTAQIDTNKGSIFIELYPESAPAHVANLKYRADKGLFRNTQFHKLTPGYVLQGGRSSTKLRYALPAEFNQHPQERGSIGMARIEDLINPERNSDPAQIYILLSDAPHMTGKYTNFGRVISGFAVLDKLRQGDQIKDVKVFVR